MSSEPQPLRTTPQPIPRRWAEALYGLVVTGIMSGTVSAIATARTTGLQQMAADTTGWLQAWLNAWTLAWPAAFVVFRLVAPRVRRAMARWLTAG